MCFTPFQLERLSCPNCRRLRCCRQCNRAHPCNTRG